MGPRCVSGAAPTKLLRSRVFSQTLPVDATAGICQGRAMIGETENQFSLTRAELSHCGRAKSNQSGDQSDEQ
jgi:hypothetical protein